MFLSRFHRTYFVIRRTFLRLIKKILFLENRGEKKQATLKMRPRKLYSIINASRIFHTKPRNYDKQMIN